MSTAFPRATGRQFGYRPEQVDKFLEQARATFEQSATASDAMKATDIRHTAFSLKRGGYSARHVDAAMDRLEEVFAQRERRAYMAEIGEDAWWAEVQQLLSEIRGRLERERGKRFNCRGIFAMGYRRSQVDAFLDRVQALLAGTGSLSPAQVRNVVFHAQWRGYDEDQVDAFLDAVVDLMLATTD
ncbi:DivIVA domain-containing protein [Leucobacter sp. W1153]|uniref:DivIVA domain-containing protein n=1 Tax=unclassified Leucobacter TaxID=2621730 RepID=UPI003F3DF4B7